MNTDRRFDSFDDAAPVIRCHEQQIIELERRVRYLEKVIDTRATPLWRRILFRIDGWPTWAIVAKAPAWRPWRHFWTS